MEQVQSLEEEMHCIQVDTRKSLEWQFSGLMDWGLLPLKKNKPSQSMEKIFQKLRHCVKCALHVGRTHTILGAGHVEATICIVGPAPNAWDDENAKPFQGPPGELLKKMIHAMQLPLESFYYLPIVRCRPPQDRSPQSQEIDTCEQYLLEQLLQIQPKVIVAMGELPAQTLFRTEAALPYLRGKWSQYSQVPLIATWDPASLLKKPSLKKEAWNDLQMVLKRLEE